MHPSTFVLVLVLTLVACCPPTTQQQSQDSSFTATVLAQISPNQLQVRYGPSILTLILTKVSNFEANQKVYVQGQLAGDVVSVRYIAVVANP